MGSDLRHGVFLNAWPTTEVLKGCSLFWKRVFVSERYISDVLESRDDIFETLRTLLDEDILKMVEGPDPLERNLHDNLYYSLGEEKRIGVSSTLPENAHDLAKKSATLDLENSVLVQSFKKSLEIRMRSLFVRELGVSSWDGLQEDLRQNLTSEIRNLLNGSNQTLTWIWLIYRNEVLLQQLSISSAVHVEAIDLPYYALKLSNFDALNAKRYLEGWEGLLPFVRRKAIDDFTIDDIISIRKSPKWDKAMNRLGELCQRVKSSPYSEEFKNQIQYSVIYEYQNVLGEHETSIDELIKDLAKGSVLAAISIIPVVGNVASLAAGLVDPVLSYMRKNHRQQNLPFFLNEVRQKGE